MKKLMPLIAIIMLFACCVTETKQLNESVNESCESDEGICPLERETVSSTTLVHVGEEEKNKSDEILRELNRELAEEREQETTTTSTLPVFVTATTRPGTVQADRVEVYHFHGNAQCSSCIAIGQYAEETVNAYFSEELKSGKLIFAHVNYDLPENKALAEKYGVTGSSLWIGTYVNGTFKAEENINVWYKLYNKEEYMNYLKGVIEDKLAGRQ